MSPTRIDGPGVGWPRRSAAVLLPILRAILTAILFALFTRTFLVQVFRVPSSSMMMSLMPGDHILVNKFIYRAGSHPPAWLPHRPLRRGEVVVFRFPPAPEITFVKRCVGGPFDRVRIGEDGLRINGERIDESSYLTRLEASTPASRQSWSVPADAFFCLGDHREASYDSRDWGSVASHLVKGRAILVLWSVEPRREASETPYGLDLWARIRHDFRRLGDFLSRARLERCLRWVR